MFKKLRLRSRPKSKGPKENRDYFSPVIVEEIEKKEEIQKKDAKPYHFEFHPNNHYFTISIYVLAVLTLGIIIIEMITNLPFIVTTFSKFLSVIQPFIVAFFIAFIMNPIVKSLSEGFYKGVFHIKSTKIRLALGILTAYVIVIGLIVGFSFYVVPQIADSITKLTSQLSDPNMYDGFVSFLNSLEDKFPTLNLGWLEEKLSTSMPEFIQMGTDLVKNIVPKLLNLSISIAKVLINILLSIAISIYMLYDKRTLSRNVVRIIYAFSPKKKATNFLDITKDCGNIFTSFIIGKSIDSTIIGILCFIIMSILNLDYAILLSVIVGVTNMIPYFGPFIGAVPGVLLYLCIRPVDAVIFAFMILGLQQFDGWILGPKILGDSTGLTPLWVIFGITVGGAYGGVFGMFIGVPIIAVIAYLADMFITNRLKKKNLKVN